MNQDVKGILTAVGRTLLILALLTVVTGCGFFSGPESAESTEEATPERRIVPTFTPTPDVPRQAEATATEVVVPEAVVVDVTMAAPAEEESVAVADTAPDAVAPVPTALPAEEVAPVDAPATGALLTVDGDLINVRGGPAIEYSIVGSAAKGEQFDIVGRTEAGDWWEVCCFSGAPGWIFGPLAVVQNAGAVAISANVPALPPTAEPVQVAQEVAAEPTTEPVEAAVEPAPAAAAPGTPPDPGASSEGWFDPNAQYQVTNFRVLGLNENNGGIRSPQSLHFILITVLDSNGNGVDGAVVRNLVGEKLDYVTGNKGSGKTEITMFWEPFKLTIASDPSGAVSSQISNQMGLAFPHLPDIVGKLGDENYEYGVCPTIDIKCQWPIQAVHFSYEITFQKVR